MHLLESVDFPKGEGPACIMCVRSICLHVNKYLIYACTKVRQLLNHHFDYHKNVCHYGDVNKAKRKRKVQLKIWYFSFSKMTLLRFKLASLNPSPYAKKSLKSHVLHLCMHNFIRNDWLPPTTQSNVLNWMIGIATLAEKANRRRRESLTTHPELKMNLTVWNDVQFQK